MDNALLVDVLHPLRDLPHVLDALPLGQLEVLVDDALKQLTPGHAAGTEGALRPQERGAWPGQAGGRGHGQESPVHGGARHFLQLPEFQTTAPLCWSQSPTV